MPENTGTRRIARALAVHRELVDVSGPNSTALPDIAHGIASLRPPAPLPRADLSEVLRQRRSSYTFEELSHDALSSLLRWALGPGRTVSSAGDESRTLRLNPSAGGLDSIDVRLLVLRPIEGIEIGTYIFDPTTHRLNRLRKGPTIEALESCLVQPEFARRAAVVVILSGRLGPTLAKYTERHYRTLHVDAGIAAQNLYLVGTALSLSCCAVSGFYDDPISELVVLPEDSVPLLAFTLGGGRQFDEHR